MADRTKQMADEARRAAEADANVDPLTGTPGAHPLGAGLGAAGAGAAGMALGSMGGPVGAIAGAVIGGLAGGLAGKEVAENVNPTDPVAEDAYWQENFRSRLYVQAHEAYDVYRPAYQYGWESRSRHANRTFDEAEPELRRDWDTREARARLEWDKARAAARDAWHRVNQARPGDFDRDRP